MDKPLLLLEKVENGEKSVSVKRIFVNTCLGCTGKCSYCYLGKMGYDNSSIVGEVRKAEELILAGRVTVNDEVLTELSYNVDEENDIVKVDDKLIKEENKLVYILLNTIKSITKIITKHIRYIKIPAK